MTHITVTVAIPGDVNSGPDLYDEVCAALDSFDENLDVATYLKLTADQIAHDADFQKFWEGLHDENPGDFAQAVQGWFGGALDCCK
ncbi:MAG: hypothetical protein WCP30_04210 [Mycobacteriaceae bacterium]